MRQVFDGIGKFVETLLARTEPEVAAATEHKKPENS
jgi:hypothetical protein